MKQIIIFLLLVIVGIMAFNVYQRYQRFSFENYAYKIPSNLDTAQSDKRLLLEYYKAVEDVNGYVISQWSAHKIDVRNPKKDTKTTEAAVKKYRDKLANVTYYETLLREPKIEPKKPLSTVNEKHQILKKAYYANIQANELRIGEKSALVYEIQKLINMHGASIEVDGLFKAETFNALKAFEEKNGLFPDGKLDAITFEYLLK